MKQAGTIRRGLGAEVVIALAAVLLLASAMPPNAAAACRTGLAYDYLKSLPRTRTSESIAVVPRSSPPRPISTELSFAPSGVVLSRAHASAYVLSSENVGFELHFLTAAAAETVARKLKWRVTANLARIAPDGHIISVLTTLSRELQHLKPRASGVSLPLFFEFRPGLYRVEITFRNTRGRRLRRFVEVFRAMPPAEPHLSIALNAPEFRPGETISANVTQLGVSWATLTPTYLIQQSNGMTWTTAPISPSGSVALVPGARLGPGQTTLPGCWTFEVPVGAEPGRYRFVLGAESYSGRTSRRRRLHPLAHAVSSEFEIQSAG